MAASRLGLVFGWVGIEASVIQSLRFEIMSLVLPKLRWRRGGTLLEIDYRHLSRNQVGSSRVRGLVAVPKTGNVGSVYQDLQGLCVKPKGDHFFFCDGTNESTVVYFKRFFDCSQRYRGGDMAHGQLLWLPSVGDDFCQCPARLFEERWRRRLREVLYEIFKQVCSIPQNP